jgi:predicted negative regulator of RcsB-dependent stress response
MAKKRVTRKQLLKEPDEFITTTGKLIHWAKENTKQLVFGGVIFFGLVILVAALGFYNKRQNQSAAALYSQAIAKYQAAGGEKEPVKALAAARADFTQLVEAYGNRPSGRLGRVMFGHLSLAGAALDDAVVQYQAALDDFDDDPGLLNVIRNGLGSAYAQKGAYPESIEQFEKLSQSSSPVLKDAALFHLGRLYDQLGRSEESQKVYQQLRTDFPETMYAQLVQDKTS